MKNLFDISGKVAVVTGGSRGIGAMIARGFVENGVKTYITSRKLDELNASAAELSQLGECIAIQADLSSVEGVDAFAAAIAERESSLDILVNNAGASWGEDINTFPEAGWDKVMNINLKAPFFLTQRLLPLLRESASDADPARVINIASIHAFINPNMNTYSYSASKAGMVQLTRHLAVDLAADKITVNGIAPGFFPSKMTAFLLQDEDTSMAEHNLLGRMGQAEDAAGTAIYMSSKAAAWMTGHTLVLDGGEIAQSGSVG